MVAINRYLDAAILKPETSRSDAKAAIQASIDLKVFSVCVRPCDIGMARQLCRGSETKVCAVLGFPHGDQLSASKADEARRYVAEGVDEIDMVANYGWARSGDWESARRDIAAVSAVTQKAGALLKVIFETAQLEASEIRGLVEASVEAGADFVKTSTGFNGAGANEADLSLMLEVSAGRIRVKASGGIRDRAKAELFIGMGVERLGANWSSCAAICSGEKAGASGSGY